MKISGASHLIFPILVFLGGCCFGPSAPFIKIAYEWGFSPETVVMTQYVFGWLFMILLSAVFFVVTVVRKKEKHRTRLSLKDFILMIVLGITIVMVSLSYICALQTIPAHLAVILLFQYTWMSIIAEAVVKRRIPDFVTVVSVVILIVSTLFAVGIGSIPLDTVSPIGVGLGLLSAVMYAVYIQLIGRLSSGISPVFRSLIMLTTAVVLLSAVLTPFYFHPDFIADTIIGGGLWKIGLVLGIIGCAMPNFLFAVASPKVPGGLRTILSSSELPASIICAVVIISESVTWVQWVGVVMLFFGIAFPTIMDFLRRRKTDTASD